MKSIFLAAGQGQRLRPLTDQIPKCMVPYLGHPLLEYNRAAHLQAGIQKQIVVRGYQGDKISNSSFTFIENKDFSTTNMVHSFFCAASEFDDDLIVSYTDIVYSANILAELTRAESEISVVIDLDWQKLWTLRMESPLSDAETLKIGADGCISEIGKKPRSLEDIQGQYIGLVSFRKTVLPKLQKFYQQLDQTALYDGKTFPQMFFTSFLQLLIDRGFQVKPVFIRGGWLEIDSLQDLERYEKIRYLENELPVL